MNRRWSVLTLATVALACQSDDAPNPVMQAFAQQPPAASPGISVALRFASQVGEGIRIYRLPGLPELAWRFEAPSLVTSAVVGFSDEDDHVYVQTPDSQLIALDLTTGRQRTIDTAVARTTFGPTNTPFIVRSDGSYAAVVDQRAEEWSDTLPSIPTHLWGTTRGRVATVLASEGGRALRLLSEGQAGSDEALPNGPFAVSDWGELVTVAVDSGMIALDLEDEVSTRFLSLERPVVAVAISPAGHRLYAATDAGELLEVDRFGLDVLSQRQLPRAATAMRTDPLGRYLLVRPAGVDSVWVIDMLKGMTIASVPGSWDDNLPVVTPGRALLIRQDADLVAIQIPGHTEIGRVEDVGDDLWLVVAWDPTEPTLQVAAERTPADEPFGLLHYVQISATYNEGWAVDLATNLRQAGMDAQVLAPTLEYDRYRVVLGPFGNWEEADDTGRRLGRPYFIFSRDTTTTF